MWLLLENRFLVFFDETYWRKRNPTITPGYLLSRSLYDLNTKVGNYLHNSKGPAIIDLQNGNELYFIDGQKADEHTVHNTKFKNKFTDLMLEEPETTEILVYTPETYNKQTKYKLILKKD